MPAINWNKQKTKKYRYLVYGIPGVGKTTLSSFMKGKTYMLSLDQSFYRIKFWQGKKDIWVIDPDKPIEDLQDFVSEFDPSKYDNLIIDNMSNFQKLWFAEKARETKNGLDNKMSDYGEINNYTIRFISKVFTWDLNILVTAWEKRDKVTDTNGQEFEQYAPDFRPDPRDFLMGNCDVVARMTQKPKTGERGLIMQSDPGTYAKNRLDNRPGCRAEEFFNA
ncbi:AAA family ATPase [Lactobacillus sp. ESL0680]|uniref:AAA family ATPase n=1 Tax=Lactobacillus sp. ESL0680 TaxID=2983210 RepID=UPI0023F9F71D|nr:AAA family ATPase [Lactobacillus sp. ESL0680]WEV39250.1 AAA family ATPase [Lactobacillus sp. ESL0680]